MPYLFGILFKLKDYSIILYFTTEIIIISVIEIKH